MKVVTVLGTRPEIIKLSPLIPKLDKQTKHILVHTGQHYNFEMDAIFFEELQIREPDYVLKIGSLPAADQLAQMMLRITKILNDENPEIVIVLGDTNSTLAGALCASKCGIKLIHIEAGCRSGNRKEPEEINRILTDHCSDVLLAMDKESYNNLRLEGIADSKIFTIGDIVTEACLHHKNFVSNSHILERLNLQSGKYVLVTIHRAENTNHREVLSGLVDLLNELSKTILLVFPIHPRTKKLAKEYGLSFSENVYVIDAVGYVDFLQLLVNARFLMTDSGGLQRETCILNVPCLVLRNETEYNELVELGKLILVGKNREKILSAAKEFAMNDQKINDIKSIPYLINTEVSDKIVTLLKKGG